MRYLVPILLVLFLAAWFLNWPVLSSQFDLNSCAEQYKFWKVRVIIFESMFLLLAVVCFLSCRGLTKALSCFSVIIVAGSIVDKAVFKISDYVYGDIVLVVLGIIASYIVYGRSKLAQKPIS